jgi:hypothetical protein
MLQVEDSCMNMGVFWNTRIDKLYLDMTTYCRPEYDFPSQSDVITR